MIGLSIALALRATALAGPPSDAPPADPAKVQRMLKLLAGIASEYAEAFDDKGAIVRPLDIDETHLLLDEVTELTAPLRATDRGLADIIQALTLLIGMRVPPDVIEGYAEVGRRYIIGATGVPEEIVPTERPSLERGRTLFRENCTGCHGGAGAGDGPDAARLGIKPANFTDRTFMRGETPRDAYNVILLGRQRGGMPAWGDALSPQQAWDLVSYVWSLSRTPAEVDAGRRIYDARCASCHGATGDPGTAKASILERPAESMSALVDGARRSNDDLHAIVTTGVAKTAMPGFATDLGEDDRWAVVAFVRTLSLEGAGGGSGPPMEPDHVAELAEVRSALTAALDAHRRGDRAGAMAYATNAYLRFEPLEKLLAERDANRADPLEAAFVTFRTALGNPGRGDPDALGRQLEASLEAATPLLRRSGGPPSATDDRSRLAVTLVAPLALAAMAYAIRRYARRPTDAPAS